MAIADQHGQARVHCEGDAAGVPVMKPLNTEASKAF